MGRGGRGGGNRSTVYQFRIEIFVAGMLFGQNIANTLNTQAIRTTTKFESYKCCCCCCCCATLCFHVNMNSNSAEPWKQYQIKHTQNVSISAEYFNRFSDTRLLLETLARIILVQICVVVAVAFLFFVFFFPCSSSYSLWRMINTIKRAIGSLLYAFFFLFHIFDGFFSGFSCTQNTHTHTHRYIYRHILISCMCVFLLVSSPHLTLLLVLSKRCLPKNTRRVL